MHLTYDGKARLALDAYPIVPRLETTCSQPEETAEEAILSSLPPQEVWHKYGAFHNCLANTTSRLRPTAWIGGVRACLVAVLLMFLVWNVFATWANGCVSSRNI